MEILEEADSISVQHIRVKDRLVDEAQRKWKKLHEKLEASKKAYYNACRQEKSALVHLNNTQADPALSRDGAKKFRDRLEKCREDVQKCKLFYEKNIEEITHYRQIAVKVISHKVFRERTPYIEEMTFEFEKCQAIEMKRSKFIIEMLSATQKVLVDLACDNRFTQLHGNLENVLRSCDESALAADLQAWSALNGKDACTEWPAFEEYTESLRAIAKKGHSNSTATGVILTKQIIKTDDMPGPATVAAPNSDCGKSNDSGTNSMTGVHKNDLHKVKVRSTQQNTDGQQENRGSPPLSIATLDSARYSGYEELRTKCTATVLYNYSPNESDEIPLQKGTV
ncbi:unnamed protein product [Haemonchus placei]|uniref:F-BAR domain-containing protein n=1 Tax=Haemonchus placei TaxID=6290 RepID=A0A0N4WH94_HAEPC|nr:unnamed protein product [Haemonchus placei]